MGSPRTAAVDSLFSIIANFIDTILFIIGTKSWWLQPFYYVVLTGDTVKNSNASIAVVFAVAYELTVLMWYLLSFINDGLDYDLVFG